MPVRLLSHKPFRLVPDGSRIRFMRGRRAGLAISAILSILSVALFLRPGLNLGIDFRGGITMELHGQGPVDPARVRGAMERAGLRGARVQRFGALDAVLVRLEPPAASSDGPGQAEAAQVQATRARAAAEAAGLRVARSETVGASVSAELFRNGMLALALSLLMILAYVWVRFEREFAIGAVVTLVLDVTKTVGFLAITRFEFDLVMVAAILTVIGYSTNDKVVVYDRVRENLRKYKRMKLRELIDLSINETLNRTLATSSTVFLAALPLALFGGATLSGFAWTMLFGIVVGTSSSIFIAAPILLLLGENRLRKDAGAARPPERPAARP